MTDMMHERPYNWSVAKHIMHNMSLHVSRELREGMNISAYYKQVNLDMGLIGDNHIHV